MRANQFITEYRRNPEQNEKYGNTFLEIFSWIQSNDIDIYDRRWGISFTKEPKLGINPTSRYNTPLGVYFYPLDYYIERRQRGKRMPFAEDTANYAHIIDMNKSKMLVLQKLSSGEQNRYSELIDEYVSDEVSDNISMPDNSGIERTRAISSILQMYDDPRSDTPAGILWHKTFALSSYLRKRQNGNQPLRLTDKRIAKPSSVFWNKLFRSIGIDVAVDMGDGIIHPGEPTQGVIFNPTAIKGIKTFQMYTRSVSKSIESLVNSAKKHQKRLSPEDEKLLLDSGSDYYPCIYAADVIKGRWPEYERKLIGHDTYDSWESLKNYSMYIGIKSFPDMEPFIAKYAYGSYVYAVNFLEAKFPLGEPEIKTNYDLWQKYKDAIS